MGDAMEAILLLILRKNNYIPASSICYFSRVRYRGLIKNKITPCREIILYILNKYNLFHYEISITNPYVITST